MLEYSCLLLVLFIVMYEEEIFWSFSRPVMFYNSRIMACHEEEWDAEMWQVITIQRLSQEDTWRDALSDNLRFIRQGLFLLFFFFGLETFSMLRVKSATESQGYVNFEWLISLIKYSSGFHVRHLEKYLNVIERDTNTECLLWVSALLLCIISKPAQRQLTAAKWVSMKANLHVILTYFTHDYTNFPTVSQSQLESVTFSEETQIPLLP